MASSKGSSGQQWAARLPMYVFVSPVGSTTTYVCFCVASGQHDYVLLCAATAARHKVARLSWALSTLTTVPLIYGTFYNIDYRTPHTVPYRILELLYCTYLRLQA
jgi:hypothetical protein